MAAGSEEPNALIRLGKGAYAEPNLRATQIEIFEGLYAESQNRTPSLKFDIGAINSVLDRFFPAGFYYKTFMWPASMWMRYEHVIRHAAGLGKVADDHNDPDRYEKTHAHCDILVAGGGATGLMAALQAAKSGARVILADEQNEFGGWLLGGWCFRLALGRLLWRRWRRLLLAPLGRLVGQLALVDRGGLFAALFRQLVVDIFRFGVCGHLGQAVRPVAGEPPSSPPPAECR